MADWLQNLPVRWMALWIFAITYLVAGGDLRGGDGPVGARRASRFKGLSPGMLPPLGIIFGLFVAFIAAQVWGDIEHTNAAINREASALRTVVLFAAAFRGEPEARLRDLTVRHIDEAVSHEWPQMAQHSATLRVVPASLGEALQTTLALSPRGEGQIAAQREIVEALEVALDARRQRIIISRSSVNGVKWSCLYLQAICTLIAIALVHVESRGAAAVAMGLFATGVAVSILVIASHDRPFTGEISVAPDLLRQVMPESTH
jgi:Protein of unknown function (DUF4239)